MSNHRSPNEIITYTPAREPYREEPRGMERTPRLEGEWGTPADCLRILYRRKWMLLLVMLAGGLIALLISLLEPNVYRSTASLEIQGLNENFLNLRDVDPASTPSASSVEPYVRTQAEILQQDAVIQQAVERLKLQQRHEYQPPMGLRARLFHSRIRGGAQYTTDAVKKNLKIEPSSDSQIVRITFDARDPNIAAGFVNTLAQTVIDQSVTARRNAAQQVNEWLRPRIEELKSKLDNSEAALDSYTRKAGLIVTDGQENIAADKLRTMQDEFLHAQADRIAKQAQFEQTANAPADTTTDNSTIRDYEIKLTDLRRQLADVSSILQPESYKVLRLQAQIKQLESAMQNETHRMRRASQNDLQAAKRRERTLAEACARQSAAVSRLTSRMTEYNSLKHDVDANRQFYDAMLQKVNEAGVASAVRESNIRLVAPAEVPFRPYKPNVPMNLAIGLFAGLVLGVGSVMMSEQTSSRLRAPGEASVYLNLPELGTIPRAQYLASPLGRILGSRSGPVERITWEQRFSGLSEAFRNAVASIVATEQSGGRADVLVITSPLPGEGKTTVASNLAIALAEIRGSVLLIDGDMRRPRQHKVFDLANSWGLSDILGEQNAADELPRDALVQKTSVPRLHVLTSGPCTDNIFSLLYSERMSRLVNRFRQEFDYVIIDAPPCLEFADARILARHAAGVLLVLRANYADKKAALAAAQRFFLDGVPILGTILNHWDPLKWGDAYESAYRKYYRQMAS